MIQIYRNKWPGWRCQISPTRGFWPLAKAIVETKALPAISGPQAELCGLVAEFHATWEESVVEEDKHTVNGRTSWKPQLAMCWLGIGERSPCKPFQDIGRKNRWPNGTPSVWGIGDRKWNWCLCPYVIKVLLRPTDLTQSVPNKQCFQLRCFSLPGSSQVRSMILYSDERGLLFNARLTEWMLGAWRSFSPVTDGNKMTRSFINKFW